MIARIGGTPSSTANLVMTTLPSAIITPQLRSMPEVRITSVWPMAMTATNEICFKTRDSVVPVKKRSDCVAKKMQASSRASKGPNVERLGSAGRLEAGGAVAGWVMAETSGTAVDSRKEKQEWRGKPAQSDVCGGFLREGGEG